MSRQTAFPGIIVESIEVSTGSGGIIAEFEEGMPEDIPSSRVKSIIEQVDLFGSRYVKESKLVYNLQVVGYAKPAAHMKARAFVRAKNPFEASIIEVSVGEKLKDMGVLRAGRNAYSVTVEVTK